MTIMFKITKKGKWQALDAMDLIHTLVGSTILNIHQVKALRELGVNVVIL